MRITAEERQRTGTFVPGAGRGCMRVQKNSRPGPERVAEQRLLWNLRHESAVVAAHPQDLTFEQTLTLIHRTLQRDYERHRVWLVVDSVLLIASAALMLIPGPNIVAYYFAFRVMGHWLSMRGAVQGLRGIAWTGRPCEPLTELREVASSRSGARKALHEMPRVWPAASCRRFGALPSATVGVREATLRHHVPDTTDTTTI